MADMEKKPTVGNGAVEAQLGNATPEMDIINLLGYKPELKRNRSMFTLLFQSLAIAAIPYGFGGPLISAIYGGGESFPCLQNK
ncbi:hypothetical protein QC763_0095200 [Podospora pseudopauciseta]|uniref:Uncharacterized protein n=1 Tax=Podospora pseudopauciseta TaxID=2093780 RepID=A0ABR0H5F1_9PEZI|nr:hypothetical protein QC763_0095200 [Podospora pseudopauciseta]